LPAAQTDEQASAQSRDPSVAVALVRSGVGRQTNAIPVPTAALGDAVLAECGARRETPRARDLPMQSLARRVPVTRLQGVGPDDRLVAIAAVRSAVDETQKR
jgi:hypothetical protein